MKSVPIDPRTTCVTIILLIVATLLAPSWKSIGALAGLCICILWYIRTPWRKFVRNLLLTSWLLLFTVLVTIWGQYADTSDFPEAVLQGGLAGIRLISIIAWATILGSAMSPSVLVAALERILSPLERLGLPLRTLSLVTMISLRFLPILQQEQQTVMRAHIARGIDPDNGSLPMRLRLYTLISVPILMNMLRRVDYLAMAMEIRAFQIQHPRTTLLNFHWDIHDYLIMGAAIGVTIGTQFL